jgi:SH3 domain protein
MQRHFVTRLLVLLLCICGIGQTLAETRYITDKSRIMLRKGESTKHKIIRTLPSGEAVDELDIDGSTGYSKIQTQDGTVGFVLTRQLQEEPIARDRLAAMEARLAELQQTPDRLPAKLKELESAHAQLQSSNEELQAERDRLQEELATIKHASANVVRITEERSELRKEVTDLTRQVADLQQENRDLSNQSAQRWFLIGAGAVAGGILIGILLPHLRFRRRKSSWGSL